MFSTIRTQTRRQFNNTLKKIAFFNSDWKILCYGWMFLLYENKTDNSRLQKWVTGKKNTAFVLKNCIFSDKFCFTKKAIFLSHKPSMNKVFNSEIIIYFFITNVWLILSFGSSFYSIWYISRILPHAFIGRSETFIRTKYNFIGSVSIFQHTAVIWHCRCQSNES